MKKESDDEQRLTGSQREEKTHLLECSRAFSLRQREGQE